MESLAHKGVSESGNVALELVVAVVLTVTFIVPAAVNISELYQSRIELTESFSVLARTFQKSPQQSISMNMLDAKRFLQRGSKNGLRIFLKYSNNEDGEISKVEVTSIVDTPILGLANISERFTVERSPFVP